MAKDKTDLAAPECGCPSDDAAGRAAAMKSAEGSTCLYVERDIVMLAMIERVATSARAAMVTLLDCRCPGFVSPEQTLAGPYEGRLTVGAAWAEGAFDDLKWHGSPYCPWVIHLDQSLISNLREFAASVAGKSRRKRSILLRQRLRDEQYECPESAAVRLARAAHTTACDVLAGREDFLRGTRAIVRAFDTYSLDEEHPDFDIFMELAAQTRGELFLPRQWRDPANPHYEKLRQLALPYETRTIEAFRHLAEKYPPVP
jgi:hypothetical protein